MTTLATRTFQTCRMRGIEYDEAETLQRDAVARLRRDRAGDGLLLVAEHAPVVTLGRAGSAEHLLQTPEELAARGIAFREVRRGGDITYHGPGQITLYPVFPMEWWKRDLHGYMRRLEEIAIRFLDDHGVSAWREPGRTGAWTGEGKCAAVGIAVNHWIAWHGLAVNVQPRLEDFECIVPCGIADRPVASLAVCTGRRYDMECEMRRLAGIFFRIFEDAGFSALQGGEA